MQHLPIHDQKYREVLIAFGQHLRNEGYGVGTRNMLPSCVREFLSFMESIGSFRLDRIEASEVQRYYEHIRSRPNQRGSGGLSSVMIGHHLYALRTFFAWLVRLQAVPFDPLTGLDFPRSVANHRTALTRSDIQALYAAAETKLDLALLALFYGCGLRRQEAVDLDLADIDLVHGRLIVRLGKFAKRRELPLNPALVRDLNDYRDQERAKHVRSTVPDGRRAFLVNTLGRRVPGGAQYHRIRELGIKAGLGEEVYPHRLRHSIATHLKENGMPMHLIQQFLGHASLDVTEHYLTGQRLHWKQERPFTQRVRTDDLR